MTATQAPLRVGIVGAGFIGRTVGREFFDHPDAAVAAVADPDEAARTDVGGRFGVPEAALYGDHESMLDGEDVDALLIGTPHALHYEQVVAGLDRGLHVFCDKPLTVDLDRARDLVERAERGAAASDGQRRSREQAATDPVLMVGYQRHLNPAFRRARERWQAPGREPTHVTAELTQDWIDRFRGTWRTDPDLSGGGNLYDSGSHLLDAVLWTTGLTPTAVSADMTFDDPDRRVDVRADLLVRFANGATASVSVFSDAPCVREHIHAWDDEGAVYLEGRQWEPRELTEIDADSGEYAPYIDRRGQTGKAEAFVEAVREGTAPPATARDALRVTAVTEAAYEAARTGEWVDVDL